MLLIAVLLSAQAATTTDSLLRLPLRVHLLHSSESAALSTTRSDSDVRTLLATANTIWRQAGIEWTLESLVREEAPNGALFEELLAGQVHPTRDRLLSIASRTELLSNGWNLFLIRDFGRIGGGVFYTELHGIILAERGFGFELPPEGRGGATLAHELGHSLGLYHVACDSARDIMAVGCWDPSQLSTLTAAQIETARTQAAIGRPSSLTFER